MLRPNITMRPWLWIILVSLSFAVFQKGVLPSLKSPQGDFANYYTASRLTLDGISIEPAYRDLVWFQKQTERYGIENQLGSFLPFPPPTTLLFLPLAPFDAMTAKRIWTTFNLGLLILSVLLLSKTSGADPVLTAILLLATGFGLVNNFLFGQQYLLLLASILFGIYFFQAGAPLLSGFCFGVLVPMKYFGIVFLIYFLWKRQLKLVAAGMLTIVAVVAVSLFVDGFRAFQTFATEVLPRHLRGEIQNPFAISYQSWNSLLRRLFVENEILNPHPAAPSAFVFSVSKNLIFWILAPLTVFLMSRAQFQNRSQEVLFQLAWIPLAFLLIAPATATYHFVLLSMSVVFFCKILMDSGRMKEAAALSVLFVLINLPLYAKLPPLAGWLTLFSYSRLWLLLLFFVSIIVLFRRHVRWSIPLPGALFLSAALGFGFTTMRDYRSSHPEPEDNALLLEVKDPATHLPVGHIFKSPDVRAHQLLFSCYNVDDKRFAIYSTDGSRWMPNVQQNLFHPKLAPNDSSILVETVVGQQPEIWLIRKHDSSPAFSTAGESPSWHPDGRHFAFVRAGNVYLADLTNEHLRVLIGNRDCYDLAFSPSGRYLAYCVREQAGNSLRIFALETNEERILLRSNDHIGSPHWSAGESTVVFSWNVSHNRDIWLINLEDHQTRRMTFHRAADDEPVWDEINRRIIFTSDRGQGLECSALYWIPGNTDTDRNTPTDQGI